MRSLLLYVVICLPLRYLHLNSPFGYRLHPLTGKYAFHAGVDLQARHDTVFAVMSGKAASVAYEGALGICIRVQHEQIEAVYGHLSRVFISPGESVEAGDPIAITGATGRVTGEHLHFSVRVGHDYIDPLEFIYQILINQKDHE